MPSGAKNSFLAKAWAQKRKDQINHAAELRADRQERQRQQQLAQLEADLFDETREPTPFEEALHGDPETAARLVELRITMGAYMRGGGLAATEASPSIAEASPCTQLSRGRIICGRRQE